MNGIEYINYWTWDFGPSIIILILILIGLSDSKSETPMNLKMNRIEDLELSNAVKLDLILEGVKELRNYNK